MNGKQAIELSKKLNSCLSKYQRKDYSFIHKSKEINRSDNKELFYILDLIEKAKRILKKMNEIKKFSNKTISKIGFYVYRLVDPRNGQTFYVGQGKGNCVFQHVLDELDYYDGVEKNWWNKWPL